MALLVAAVVVAAAVEVAVAAMAEVAEHIVEASEPRTFARPHATVDFLAPTLRLEWLPNHAHCDL